MKCPKCSKDTPAGSVVCPFCAAPLDDAPTAVSGGDEPTSGHRPDTPTTSPGLDEAVTALDPQGGLSEAVSLSDSGQHGRFLPGTTVADRYRIVGLLGRGGMGEVYRADDLKLGQQVALKFLPHDAAGDEGSVEQLIDEVRMARQVSHPNVCRVFDVGEAAGHHYVSMEYVDGEDLSSLLRRIGRLPEDKAVDIARQLCAALAAAHAEGVLHRDLKPANIMLDGRGRVKLTDFGLAGVAEVRAGTPIYMAPEQLAGKKVSVKSDLYSMGLVLHELFTGKRVFDADSFEELSRQHQSSLTSSRSSTGELDPAIDRIIARCIEEDPVKRPDSALAVAAGLPGADPLAAALAAGETPSPQMVAEAGGEGSLPLAMAIPLLALSLVCAIAVGLLQSRVSLAGWVPFEDSPELLDARAREIVEELGYENDHADTAGGFVPDLAYINWLRRQDTDDARWEVVSGGRPPSIAFWWRGSPAVLVPTMPQSPASTVSVTLSNPPRTTPGMISMRLDPEGRLLWLDVVPERVAGPVEGAGAPTDWPALFEIMGLQITDFREVEARLLPDRFADERRAWEGVLAEDPEVTLTIEAAAYAGRPTSVRVFAPYNPLVPNTVVPSVSSLGFAAFFIVALVLGIVLMFLTVIFGALFVARRNVRSGRGDARGARRLGFGIAIALGVEWLLAEHTFSLNDINAFMHLLLFVGAVGGLTWALYLAVEPFMRRHAPRALIGWTRFMDGRLADPLVGRDLLLGCAAGALSQLLWVLPMVLGERGDAVVNYTGIPPATLQQALAQVAANAITSTILALGLLFLYGLSFVALRRKAWLTYAAWLIFFGSIGLVPGITVNGMSPSATTMTSVFWIVSWSLWLFVLFRLGILVYVVMGVTSVLLQITLPTLDMSSWYSSNIVAGLAIFFGLSAYAFYRSVPWKGGLAEALAGD